MFQHEVPDGAERHRGHHGVQTQLRLGVAVKPDRILAAAVQVQEQAVERGGRHLLEALPGDPVHRHRAGIETGRDRLQLDVEGLVVRLPDAGGVLYHHSSKEVVAIKAP